MLKQIFGVCVALMGVILTGCATDAPPVIPTPLAVDVSGLPIGGFELVVTGDDVSFDFDGVGEANFDPQQGFAIYLQQRDSYNGVSFVLPEEVFVGTYALGDSLEVRAFTTKITRPGAMITQDPLPTDDMPLRVYGEEIRGTLTLTSVDPFTGAFYFGAIDGGITRVARGQFNAIPRPDIAPTPTP